MEWIFVVIAIALLINLFLIFSRNKKKMKTAKRMRSDRLLTLKKHEDLKRRLNTEQENAAKHIERRNKTLELYRQVKEQINEQENEEPED